MRSPSATAAATAPLTTAAATAPAVGGPPCTATDPSAPQAATAATAAMHIASAGGAKAVVVKQEAPPAAVAAAPPSLAAAGQGACSSSAAFPAEDLTELSILVAAALDLVGPLPGELNIALVQQLGSRAGAAAALPFRALLGQATRTANVGMCRAVLAIMFPSLPWPQAAEVPGG